ncbi:MFS transporter [Paenibacillus sp. 7124]|uniref:MFS transporter n=1 Tax=Paenibacillus apii TaxID=1850370 RepID=A0A6M1PSU5_9BACL|nr:MFS transporter [Paenibacillus apii]NGM85648.1 MFS transporter [Paenibacillus apii]NJJ40440.1 MFS transporter [Paenibacillus apii]
MSISSVEKSATKKITLHIVPYLFIAYLVSFLDRVSITYSSLGGMDKALGITSSAFGLISGIFFIGYFACTVPSNIMLNRYGARKWIARILVAWGIVTVITAWSNSVSHLYILRFLLGVAEAGFFPGVILYITFWFRSKERAKVVALFMTAPPLANALGAPLSIWVVQNIHWAGMPGWRWLFIFAGIPAVVLGIITFFYLSDKPDQAKWLSSEEKEWLSNELKNESINKRETKALSFKEVSKDKKVWKFAFTNLTYVIGLYGISFWMPRIIKSLSDVLTDTQVGYITMAPYICGAIAMVLMGVHSDRTRERKYHAAFAPLLGAIGLIGALIAPSPLVAVLMICVTTAGLYSFSGPYWAFTSATLTAEAAVVGIGIINSLGNFGGFIGPYVIGILNDVTGTVSFGIAFLALMLILTCIQVLAVKSGKNRTIVENQEPRNAV